MRKKFLLMMLTLLFVAMGSSGKLFAEVTDPVAKVGNTEYATIDEAIAAWTHNTTLTLLADVTLSDVVKLSSKEHHILDLGTYTMTAASGNNAIEITCQGLINATYAITVNADANNPGGITATGKACIYYSKSGSTKDRPIIRIYNGVFNGSYSINSKSNGNTNCPQIWIYGGTFNGNVNLTKNMLRVFGGVFNGWINCTGDQSAYREISGGSFKSWQFMTADADNKFWVGTSKANYDVGCYVDDNGYLVVGGPIVTEPNTDSQSGVVHEASTANYGGWSSYLKYSSAKDNGLYYTSVKEALADNNKSTGSVTVYVDKLDMSGISYKGTIVVPAESSLTITNAPANLNVITEDGFILENENGTYTSVAPVAQIDEEKYTTLADAIEVAQSGDEIVMLSDVTLDAAITLPAGITFNGNGKQINGTINAGGDLTFAGHTKVTAFSASYYDRKINIGEGACLEITGTGRVTLGYGNTFNITGSIENAKTADKANVQPSLIIPAGISITGGNDAAMNVTNAYVKIGSTSSKNSAANGTFTMNFTNSIAEFTNQLTFAEPTNGMVPTFNLNIKNSILTTGTKLIAAAPNSNIVVDNSNVTLATYFRNSGKFNVKNGSVLTGATIQFGENGGNNGELIVDASTFKITASSVGHALDGKTTGKIVLNNAAIANIDYIKDMDELYMTKDSKLYSKTSGLNIQTEPTYKVVYNNEVYEAVDATIYVETKAELKSAIEGAEDGTFIKMTANIDYGTDQLAITKAITLDLGGKTLTTQNAYGGMSVKGNPTIKNGTIVHASNTAAIKVWNATAFEDLVIDVQGKGDANKTIGGIVLQSGSTTRVGSIKNVIIEGAALTNGIETYNCGDATENVIGSMENVTIDAVGTGMLISAPCGTATNCDIKGGVNGIEIWIKGTYSASLDLVDSNVEGGVYAHDEFSNNPDVVNNGILKLTADEETTGADVDDVTLTIARAKAENVQGEIFEYIMENAVAKGNNTFYASLQDAIKAAAPAGIVDILANVTVDEWIMIATNLTMGDGTIITLDINGMTINGNNHTITIKDIESAGNGGYLFYDAAELNIKDLTISYAAGLTGGICLKKGTIEKVTFNGGKYGVLPGVNGVTIKECTFNGTTSYAVYYEDAREGIVVTGNKFNTAEGAYAIIMRSNEQFTNNTITKGRVNIANSSSATVTGNDFGEERFKVYNGATATIEENTINVLAFNDNSVVKSKFKNNELSEEAQAVLDAAVTSGNTWGGIDWTLTYEGTLTIAPTKGTPVADPNCGKTYEVGAWREAVRYNSKGEGVAIEGWPYDRSKVKTLVIEEGVISIGSFTAQSFTNLTGEVVIPSTVKYIGQEAFQKSTMTKLTFAPVPAGETGEELCIAQGAFKNLIIEEVSLPADRPVHLHAWVFNNCHNLKDATMPATVESVHGTNHIDYFKDFNAHSNPTWTKSSEIFAYNKNMETVTFGNKEVMDMFYANNNGTSKDYLHANVGLVTYGNIEDALAAAAESGEELSLIKNATASEQLLIENGETVVIDLKGKKMTGSILAKNANLTVKNGTITNEDKNVSAIEINAGTLTLNEVNISSERHAVRIDGKVVATIKGGTYKVLGSNKGTYYAANISGAAKVTIDGGTFVGPKGTSADSGSAVNVQAGAEVTINGGNFSGGKTKTLGVGGNLVIYGGTYDQDPSAYVAEKYMAEKESDDKYVVCPIVAKIGETPYASLQKAINAVKNNQTITLVSDVIENVTLTEKVGLYYTIDGAINRANNTMNGKIVITPLSDENDNRRITIKNINFVNTADAAVDFISCAVTNHYPRLTVEGCTFTGNGKDTDVALRLKTAYGAVIKNCTGTGLHSFLQNTAGKNLIIENVKVTDSKSGLALGTVQGVTVKGSNIDVAGYGIRMDANTYNNNAVIESNTVEAFIPVVVRKVNTESNITFNGENAFTATNTDGLWCAIGATEYEANGQMPTAPATGKVSVTLNDTGLDVEGIYGYTISGEGTAENPYLINNINDLIVFRNNVNAGNDYSGKYVKLNADIDLNNEAWEPIGYMGKKFIGNFDGGSHTISNLKVVKELDNASANNSVGLFGRVDSPATIKNLTINNATVKGSLYVGAVVGYAYTGNSIENVTVKGNIAIDAWWYAGVIGGNGYMSLVNNCHVIGNDGSYIKGNNGSYIGGIWGFRGEGANNITNCTVTNLAVEGVDRVGGISGMAHYGNTISDCSVNKVTIAATDEDATTVGIIAGACQGTVSEPSTITYSEVVDVTVTIDGNNVDASIYGTNIDGTTPFTNYVAIIGGMQYITLADAVAAAKDGETIEFLPLATNKVVAMNASLYGKSVTITGTAKVDWSKGWLFVGRGGEGNATLTFDGANLTSASNSASYGIHVSGREKNTSDKYNGTVVIKNSTIDLDYLINKGEMTLDNATLTVKNGFSIGGRPASETESGADATATIELTNGSKVVVNEHNGMGLGYEAIGVMNINDGSTFECTKDFLVTAKGTMNVNGGVVTTNVKITNNGVINVSGESKLNIASFEGEEINFLDGATIKDSNIGGGVFVAGNVTFDGHNTFNMIYDFGTLTDYYGTTAPMKWNVKEGASLTLTDKARYGLGYGDNVTIIGSIDNALTARENLTENERSLFMHGLVAQESKGWNCNSALTVENAYVVIGNNNSFGNKPGNYGGTYTFNIKNSVVDASRITFYEALSTSTFTFEGSDVKMGTFMTRDTDSKFILKNSKVLSTTTTNGNDEGNYNAGELTLVNSSLTYSATLSNTGDITVDATSTLTAPAISGTGTITIDAADFVIGGGDVQVVTANMNGFTGTINVVNNNYVTAVITETGIVIKENNLEGEGTVDNPYVLETLTELELFRNKVNAGDNYAGKYVKLTADVDLSATRSANNWEPIGTTACPFKGTFDGDNKVISNLVVEGESYVGLFGKTVGATINNVTINNANVKGTSYVGAIVGMGYTGTINNCHVTGTIQIEGNYMVGGISGQGYAIIYNSSVIATANSGSYVKGVHSADNLEGDNVGGIVGHCGENNTLTANTVKNITVSGTRKVGGIVGIANMGTNIDACVVENVTIETTATEEYANDNIKTMSIGALIGQYQNNGSNGTVTNSIVKTVTFNNVNDVTVNVGPITGGTRGTTVVIEPTGVTASNNDIYMSTITGSNNSYLMNAVAEIGGVKYYSLQEAINKVGDGETITLLSDVNVTTPAYGQNALNYSRAINSTIDLNGKILSANTGNSVFRFNITDSGATSDVTVKMMNGTVVAGADTWCAVMAAGISADVKAIFNLEDITINGSKAGDLAVKSWDNAVVNANNVTIETTNGAGGFYAVGGEIVLNNCTVNQKGLHTAPYLSMAFAVSTEGKMTINSGTYSSEPTAASEGYNQGTSHGSWVGGVMNSGGTLIINGGTFSNDNYGDNSLATAARGLIFADTKGIVEVNGGTFNALKSIFDFQNNLGGTSPVITVKGGEYNANPKVVTSYGSIVIPDDYEVKNPTNGTWVVKQVSGTQTREFASAGWYWFSTYINLEGADGLKDLQDALVDENGDCVGKQIKGQDGFTQYFSGYNAWSPGLPAITTAEMYMVNVSAPVTVELTGKFVDYENRNITLNPGWNWIGYPVRETVAIENAFAAPFTPSDGDIIKAKSGGVSQYYKVAGGWFPSFDLVPGHGYKYLSVNPTTTGFCYTTENNSRGIANDNVIAENRWTPAASEFAENMVVIAMLNINGELADENYEVAAFANGVCRGSARPIYNEKLGKHILFMTINGEEVEELTFKCYDVNNGTEYELSNRVNYSNDAILGSIDEPYMFNMNFLNIEESSLDMINIYPNPTTTDRAINLQATCDNVEVFNALGVKVAEYQNVDTIDALETAGVYVIRVTINGETRNCRLVVK